MALGGTQMSTNTEAPTTTLSATFPQVTDGNQNNSDGGGMGQRGANYFFGFLITFVVLLLVFIGCGIGSRRRYLARRNATFLGGLEPWGLPKAETEQKRPALYEKLVAEPIVEDQWRYTMPLSVTLLRQTNASRSEENDLEAQRNNDTNNILNEPPAPTSLARDLLRSWRPNSYHERKPVPQVETDEEYGLPEALDVAVMIAMPSSPSTSKSNSSQDCANDKKVPEYQIGTTKVPWHSELTMNSTPDAPP